MSRVVRSLESFVRSRSDDPVSLALGDATDQIVRALTEVGVAHPVVIIDGRSGAGKTTLARSLVRRWPAGRVQLISLDSIYPGWDGMEAGVERARTGILLPHARGEHGRWQRWDWQRQQDGDARAVDPSVGLIVEGCGLLTPATALLADVRVWVDAPVPSRRTRAFDRDGDAYFPHWDRWAAQEDAHIERHRPQPLADVRVTVP